MEWVNIIIAVLQLPVEYGIVQPLVSVARRIVSNRQRKAAFRQALMAAHDDLKHSEFAELTAVLLDEYYLRKREVIDELLNALLIAPEVDYDRLQAVYAATGLGQDSPDIRLALRFLVERVREHAADKNDWFRAYYALLLQRKGIALAEQRVELQTRILQILEQLSTSQPEEEISRLPGLYVPGPRCRTVWGRDALIREVLCHLDDPEEPTIISLSGGPGYGKTEVARRVAVQALAQDVFADVLWVTARQTEFVAGHISRKRLSGLLSWNELLNELATQVSCPVIQVRRCLREEKLLIVLDNAEDAYVDSIIPELTSMLSPSRVLMTTREEKRTPSVKLIRTLGLEREWSHRLLRDEAAHQDAPALERASDEELDAVHRLSCGAPLALHFVVGRVLHDHALEPVMSELEQASPQVAEFYQFCLGAAWQRISDTAKAVLRYMGYMADKSVSWSELAEPWDLSPPELNAALADLERWYLVEARVSKRGKRRYDLHPWVRSSIRGRLVDDWRPSPEDVERVADWKIAQIARWQNEQSQEIP